MSLIAVDEDEVELLAERGCYLQSVAYVQCDTVGKGRQADVVGDEVFELVVYLYGVDMSVGCEPFGKAECGVCREGTYLEYVVGAKHSGKHLQQPSLIVPTLHTGIE